MTLTRLNHFFAAVILAAVSAQAHTAQTTVRKDVSVDLPGSARLPNAVRDGTLASISASGPSVSFGCEGMQVSGLMASYEDDLQRIYNYYSNNAGSLALQALIYTQPSLYSMLNNTIADFRKMAEKAMMSCNDIRKMIASEKKTKEGKAYNECIKKPNNTAKDCMAGGAVRNEYFAAMDQAINSWTSSMNSYISNYSQTVNVGDMVANEFKLQGSSSSGGGGGSSGSGGNTSPASNQNICQDVDECGSRFNKFLIASYGGANTVTIDFMDKVMPGLEPRSTSGSGNNSRAFEVKKRQQRTQEWVVDRRFKYDARLDAMVKAAGQGQSYADLRLAYINESYTSPPPPAVLRELANMRERAVTNIGGAGSLPPISHDESKEWDKANVNRPYEVFYGTKYASAIGRITREQAIAAADTAISEIEAMLRHARTQKGVREDYKKFEGIDKYYEEALVQVKKELERVKDLDVFAHQQKKIYREVLAP